METAEVGHDVCLSRAMCQEINPDDIEQMYLIMFLFMILRNN